MHREYDIFEVLPSGSEIWRMCAHGRQNAEEVLTILADQTANECYAIHIQTKEIIARVNIQQNIWNFLDTSTCICGHSSSCRLDRLGSVTAAGTVWRSRTLPPDFSLTRSNEVRKISGRNTPNLNTEKVPRHFTVDVVLLFCARSTESLSCPQSIE